MTKEEQEQEMTTLSVPKDFRQHLTEDYEGSNDLERLKNWGQDYSEDMAELAAEEYIESEMFRMEAKTLIRKSLSSYDSAIREEVIDIVKEEIDKLSINKRTGELEMR